MSGFTVKGDEESLEAKWIMASARGWDKSGWVERGLADRRDQWGLSFERKGGVWPWRVRS